MSRSASGPKLPRNLLDELGASDDKRNGSRRQRSSLAAQRKQQRKAFRVEKRTKPERTHLKAQPPTQKSKLKTAVPKPTIRSQPPASTARKPHPKIPEVLVEPDEDDDEDENESEDETERRHIPRSVRNQLDDDDAQIARLEKKLGRKRKQPDDGMASLFRDLDGVSDDDDDAGEKTQFDSEAADWLRAKRRKASVSAVKSVQPQGGESDFSGFSDDDEVFSDAEERISDEELVSEDDDMDDNDDDLGLDVEENKPRKRENPYTAPVPVSEQSQGKYVPPSRRVVTDPDDASRQRLRRQIQGLLNRLSENNLVDIVKQIGTVYLNNARHDVSQTLLDHLANLLSDKTALNDTFIILHAGFVAALQRTVGMEFGAAAIQRFVEEYDQVARMDPDQAGKRTLNLAHTLAQLYNFQVIGSNLIYDLIKSYIQQLSETDAELLLKIVRNSGWQLRQDDASALKEISVMLQATVKRLGGEDTLNVRTKFMIETIENLKNNKQKAGQGAAAIATEHVQRMKKTLGSLQSTSGVSVRSTEPLRIGLTDLRESDLKGKWWLVGASFRDEAQIREKNKSEDKKVASVIPEDSTSITGSEATPDMASLARAFGMNTDIRKAIFVNVMTAASLDEARDRFIKMRLTKKQMREVPYVLVRCATAEKTWNAYYADVTKKLSSEREIRKALWNPLLEMLSNLDNDDSDQDEDEEDQSRWWQEPQARFNVSKLYGALIGESVVPITVLAGQDLLHPSENVRTFLEMLFVGMFCQIGRGRRSRLEQVLDQVVGRDDTVSFLPVLRRFFCKHVAKTELMAPEEKRTVKWGCEKADEILAELGKEK